MLSFLSCLSFHPENPDSDISRHCQHLDLPDSMILRSFRCCPFYPVYPSILKILIQTSPATVSIWIYQIL